ncbi:hypothetical protein EC968_001615 [Mortierella alpina]|nr:hypothetical protein EC968_001615 [Mortierella alpina]
MNFPRHHRNTIRLSLLYLYILSNLLHASAQSYTTLDEKTLYFIPSLKKPQLFSLDLTQSWDAVKAPLETLPTPPWDPWEQFSLYMAALAVNYDKNSLLYFNSHRTTSVFNITTKTWQLGTRLTGPNTRAESIYGSQVATDPSTGIAYIPSVEHVDNFPIYSYNTFQGYNPNATKTIVPGVSIPYYGYGAVWSTIRKSVLFYGGVSNGTTDMGLMEYQPTRNQWTSVNILGTLTPGDTGSPCMASAYNGTKIVMLSDYKPQYSVFILDVNALVWTKGADLRIGEERSSAACAVVGDYFIIAGGIPPPGGGILQPVMVYNMKLNQWTDSYIAPHTPAKSTGVGKSSTTETASPAVNQEQRSDEGMPAGTKIGLIAGGLCALVILLSCGAFLIRRRKLRKSRHADQQIEHESNTHFSKTMLELSEKRPQQPSVQSRSLREMPFPTSEGHLKSQSGRNPQHHSSSIPLVAIQQWQCAQRGQNPQYTPSLASVSTTPTLVQYPRQKAEDGHSSHYHPRLNRRPLNHNERRRDPQDDLDHHDRHTNNPQASCGNPDYDENFPPMHQDPRMKNPQGYGHSSAERDASFLNIQHRFHPQDYTRRSTASQLEFHQAWSLNNPQDFDNQAGGGDETLYLETQRIRPRHEEYMVRHQSSERIRLAKDTKLRTFEDYSNYTPTRRQY